jgi:hypothetical protein
VLATFKQRVPEIDLLVDTGDHVTLGITSYEPFVEDPKILGVKKAKPGMPGATGAGSGKSLGQGLERDTTVGETGAGAAEEGTEVGNGKASEAGEGSGDVTLPPMGPPLEDEPEKPPAGGDGGGSNRS